MGILPARDVVRDQRAQGPPSAADLQDHQVRRGAVGVLSVVYVRGGGGGSHLSAPHPSNLLVHDTNLLEDDSMFTWIVVDL